MDHTPREIFAMIMADQQADAFAKQGIAEDQIEQQLEAVAFTRTPVFSAIMGAVGTMVAAICSMYISSEGSSVPQ